MTTVGGARTFGDDVEGTWSSCSEAGEWLELNILVSVRRRGRRGLPLDVAVFPLD